MNAAANDSVFIQKTALFSSLAQNEINFIISRCGKLNLLQGYTLFSPDEEAEHFYILKSGAIRVYKTRGDGSEDEMARFTEGDTIGDFDFARGAKYDATAKASEDSVLIEFPGYGNTIDSIAAENPDTVCNILLNAIIMMTDRIKSTQKLILQNMTWVQELHRRAYEDSSTGLWKQTLLTDEIVTGLKDPSGLIMIKPDRFKILVDSRGHSAGDEAMIKIALILKNFTRETGHGWAIRFKSNEAGLVFYNCGAGQAEKIANELAEKIAALEPVPSLGEIPAFSFSASISWSVWPGDDPHWESFFSGTYAALMDVWRKGGEKIFHYRKVNNNG
jgi:diguanylate cyclase (GGDEF)-like protein